MIILSRKKNDSVIIDETIEVTVVEIRDDKVRLGINAPMEIPIHRKEIWDVIRKESEPKTPAPSKSASPAEPAKEGLPLNEGTQGFLDDLREQLAKRRKTKPDRAEVAGVLVEAVSESGIDLSKTKTLPELKNHLSEMLRIVERFKNAMEK